MNTSHPRTRGNRTPFAPAVLAVFAMVTASLCAAPGDLDTSFNTNGKVVTNFTGDDSARGVAQQTDGKIVVAGYCVGSTYDFAVVRYLANGTLDTGFGSGGRTTTHIGARHDDCRSMVLQSDGMILLAGGSEMAGYLLDFSVARYQSNGVLDPAFGTGGKVTTEIGGHHDIAFAIALQSDGKIVVAGYSRISGNDDFAVVRYLANGTLDPDFGTGGKVTTPIGPANDSGQGIALQADGKIVVAGYANNGSNEDIAVVRYLANGTLDPDFGTGGKVTTPIGSGNDYGYSVAVQGDGKIVVAGSTHNGSNDDFALVRYLANGTLDPDFGTGGKVATPIGSSSDGANSLALQSDGKIALAGYTRNGSYSDFALARYLSDGSLDSGFGNGGKVTTSMTSLDESGDCLALQSDGKLLVAGFGGSGSNWDIVMARYQAFSDVASDIFISPVMKFPTVAGRSYQIQASTEASGPFSKIGTVNGDGTEMTYTDTRAMTVRQFYKVVAE